MIRDRLRRWASEARRGALEEQDSSQVRVYTAPWIVPGAGSPIRDGAVVFDTMGRVLACGNRAEIIGDFGTVGGGAAGLSAALVLGRARRRTLLIDAAQWEAPFDPDLLGFVATSDRRRHHVARWVDDGADLIYRYRTGRIRSVCRGQ